MQEFLYPFTFVCSGAFYSPPCTPQHVSRQCSSSALSSTNTPQLHKPKILECARGQIFLQLHTIEVIWLAITLASVLTTVPSPPLRGTFTCQMRQAHICSPTPRVASTPGLLHFRSPGQTTISHLHSPTALPCPPSPFGHQLASSTSAVRYRSL